MTIKNDYLVLHFINAQEWEKWIEKNHAQSDGVWLKFSKKNSTVPSVNYSDALDVALCYGWIDSLVHKFDENSYLQKWSPRKSKSIWSKINTERVEKLIQSGRMQSAGQEQIDAAKKDGRWEKAYSSSSNMEMPADFLQELTKHKKAAEFFQTLSKTNTYAIGWRLETAKKPETRMKRMNIILEMLEKGEKFH